MERLQCVPCTGQVEMKIICSAWEANYIRHTATLRCCNLAHIQHPRGLILNHIDCSMLSVQCYLFLSHFCVFKIYAVVIVFTDPHQGASETGVNGSSLTKFIGRFCLTANNIGLVTSVFGALPLLLFAS